jgi:aspartyl-tRNA(Asn)/glutamyl-tRNA(Gln) amidotransferase subunit A
MSDEGLCYMPANEMASMIRARKISPVEVVDELLLRIERLNPAINAYCAVTADGARLAAREAEKAAVRGNRTGPLHGIPFSVKDLIITKGVPTTLGSKIYEHYVPQEDAPVVERLKNAGAILIGKTNTSEFGWKAVTDNRMFGVTRNPWDLHRTPGGSSGGAGAAVAAGMGPLAVGTDGGGSIRIPSSFCGVFGLKPSFGRVPFYPPSPNETLIVVGPMSRTVRDVALMLDVMAGPDERDRYSLPCSGSSYLGSLERSVKGLRIAWSPGLGYAPVAREVQEITEKVIRIFEDLGCQVEQADPGFEEPMEVLETIVSAALYAKWGHSLNEWGDKMDPGLVRMIRKGKDLTASHLMQAFFRRSDLWEVMRLFFARYDLLLTPTVSVAPFEAGIDAPSEADGETTSRRGWYPFTYPFNLTGHPAASVPCGWTRDNLPVGLQIVGRRYDEGTVLRLAAAYEEAAPWADRHPKFSSRNEVEGQRG